MGSQSSSCSDSDSDGFSRQWSWSNIDPEPVCSNNESSSDSEDDEVSYLALGDLISKGRTTPVINYMERNKMTQEYYYRCLEDGKNNPPHISGPYMPLPVGEAAYLGQKDIMNAIIARGFDPNAQDYASTDHDCRRPIHYAAVKGHLDVVKCLVENHGVDVESTDRFGGTALTQAIMNDDLVMVKYLVEAGAALLNAGANIHETDRRGMTSFLMAADSLNVDLMRFLVSQGADPNVVDNFGNTALHTMIQGGRYGIKYEQVAYLVVELGMDCLNTRNSNGHTPLSLAISTISQARIIELLANYGSNIEEEMFQWEDDKDKLPILQKPGGRKVLNHLKELSSKPRTLQDIVCIKIRRIVGAQLESAVNDLPLPEIIRNLVKIKWISDQE